MRTRSRNIRTPAADHLTASSLEFKRHADLMERARKSLADNRHALFEPLGD